MSKLSMDALKERAGAVASESLLMSISGGTENSCHDSTPAWTITYGDCSNPCGGAQASNPSMSWSEIYHTLGEFFKNTGF